MYAKLPIKDMTPNEIIVANKTSRKALDEQLQLLKQVTPYSRERALSITKVQEAIMWLGMELKAINEANPGASPNPYPDSYNPDNTKIEPTADGLKL